MENIFLNLTFPFTLLTLIISLIINLVLAFTVYKSNPKSATNKLFALLSLSIILWLVEFYISIQINSVIFTGLTWIRLSLFFATPMTTLFFLFSHTFPDRKLLITKKPLSIILFLNFLVMAITVSPYVFTDARIVNNFPSPIPGLGLPVFVGFILILIFETIYILIKKRTNSFGLEKKQISFIIWGILLMHLFMFSTVLIPVAAFQKTTFVPLFPVYTLIFTGFTAYAIVQYRLFNIKLIATEAITFVIWMVLFSKIFSVDTTRGRILDSSIFAFVVLFGIMLIKSVLNEVRMREQTEKLYGDLKEADEKLKKISQEKSDFIFITSHQLRGPMTIIKGYISMILEGMFGNIQGKFREALNKVYISNDRLIKLINDLLDVSRIERGKMEYTFKEQGLTKIVSEAVEELKLSAKDKGLNILFEEPKTELPLVLIDEDYIRQVVVNLIDNAIKYSDHGDIEIELKQTNGKFLLSVKDHGMGISKDTLPHLFEQYSRGEKTTYDTATKGMGLGLYVAKKIVDDHHGRIWAESKGVGRGATFFVELTAVAGVS